MKEIQSTQSDDTKVIIIALAIIITLATCVICYRVDVIEKKIDTIHKTK